MPFTDSLNIQVWTGSAAIQQTPVGLKGNVSGIVDAKIQHQFTKFLYSELALQLSPTYTMILLDKASLGFQRNGFTINSGLLSTHIGRAILYKPFSVYNQFTRSSVIWDSDGFGVVLSQKFIHSGMESGFSLSNRESGSVYLISTVRSNRFITDHSLIGLRTSEIEYQDNSLTIGNDFKIVINNILTLHSAIKYCLFQGYGNSSIKPGYDFVLFNETKSVIQQRITLNTMIYYKESEKSYTYYKFNCGVNGEYMFLPWLGIYTGYEYQKSMNVDLHIPEIGLSINPLPSTMCIRIGGESVRQGLSHLNRAMAVVWYAF
jgi:hypothetical protein